MACWKSRRLWPIQDTSSLDTSVWGVIGGRLEQIQGWHFDSSLHHKFAQVHLSISSLIWCDVKEPWADSHLWDVTMAGWRHQVCCKVPKKVCEEVPKTVMTPSPGENPELTLISEMSQWLDDVIKCAARFPRRSVKLFPRLSMTPSPGGSAMISPTPCVLISRSRSFQSLRNQFRRLFLTSNATAKAQVHF